MESRSKRAGLPAAAAQVVRQDGGGGIAAAAAGPAAVRVAGVAAGRSRQLLALGLVWGSSWIAADTLAESVPRLRAAAVRCSLAAVLCVPVLLAKRRKFPRRRSFLLILLLSATLIAGPAVLLGWVQPQLPSATVAVLFAAMPLLLAVPAPRAAMQAAIVALGALAFALDSSFSLSQAAAAAVVLLVVGSIAGSSLAVRRQLREENPVVVAAGLLGAAAVLLWGASLLLERGQPVVWTRDAVLSVVYLAAVAGAPAYVTYVWLLQGMEAYQVGTLQWIEPLVAVMESAVWLRLRPSFSMIAGAVVTLGCWWVVLRARPEDDNPVSLAGN